MSDLETRAIELEYREEDGDGWLEGLAVPYGEIAPTFSERFEPGSVEPDETVWLRNQHDQTIGVIKAVEERAEGFWIRAKLSLDNLSKSVRDQLRDGTVRSLSVGFVPLEERQEDGIRVVTRALLREVSVVSRPAYAGASILATREESKDHQVPNHKEESAMTDSENQDLVEVREEIAEIGRRLDMLPTAAPVAEDKIETRAAGELIQLALNGDKDVEAYLSDLQTRAYTGGTSADSPIKDAWVGDLTRIFDASSGVLASVFSTGSLPEKGMSIEFAELGTNTVKFEEQVNEGDDLAFGKVTLTTRTAPVKTYGGYTQLTVQEVKRSTLPILNRHFEAQAAAAGARKKLVLRNEFNTVRAAQIGDNNVVTLAGDFNTADHIDWSNLVVDAAIAYEAKNANFDVLVVSPAIFKRLNALVVDGNKVLNVAPDRNTIGRLNLPGLTGDLAGVTVVVDTAATGDTATFVNGRALRQYESGIVQLSDDNIINLSSTFSAYKFGAVAAEIPGFIVPVVAEA